MTQRGSTPSFLNKIEQGITATSPITAREIAPTRCEWELDQCEFIGAALVQRYDESPSDRTIGTPSGIWRWLCSEHTAIDLGLS